MSMQWRKREMLIQKTIPHAPDHEFIAPNHVRRKRPNSDQSKKRAHKSCLPPRLKMLLTEASVEMRKVVIEFIV